jgi:hypothetical protein
MDENSSAGPGWFYTLELVGKLPSVKLFPACADQHPGQDRSRRPWKTIWNRRSGMKSGADMGTSNRREHRIPQLSPGEIADMIGVIIRREMGRVETAIQGLETRLMVSMGRLKAGVARDVNSSTPRRPRTALPTPLVPRRSGSCTVC